MSSKLHEKFENKYLEKQNVKLIAVQIKFLWYAHNCNLQNVDFSRLTLPL